MRGLWSAIRRKGGSLKRWQKILIFLGILLLTATIGLYLWIFPGLPSIDQLHAGLALPRTHIYDRNGHLLFEGVDIEGIVRALWINLQGGEIRAGGSTITQQVVRNLLLDPQQRSARTLQRKLREIVLAVRLAQSYSHDEILALYLNQTYYGNL